MDKPKFDPSTPYIKVRTRDKTLKQRILNVATRRVIDPTDVVREGITNHVQAEEIRLGITLPAPAESAAQAV